jgi:ABC-2 type transport system ATP-binding protein
MPALVLDGVTKHYGLLRRARALDRMSFEVPTGSICGLIGPNGAGKTTAFAAIGGLLQVDEGRIDILGEGPFTPEKFKGRLGLLPQDAQLGLSHTPQEMLVHLGLLQGMGWGEAQREARQVLGDLDLGDRALKRIGSLSHGMRRRLAAATALLGHPELVLLDEPMSGLDPRQVRGLRELLARQRGERTLVISSHNLAELEMICDHVLIVDKGRCTHQGTVAEVTGRAVAIVWTLGSGRPELDLLRQRLPEHALQLDGPTLTVRCPPAADLDDTSLVVAAHLADAGIAVRELRRGLSLEQGFLDRVDGTGAEEEES